MTKPARIAAASAAFIGIACASSAASAGTLDDACKELDRSRETSCRIERPGADEWVLHTGYPIGTGRKSTVEAVETRFCEAARSAGVAGRVLRASELPGVLGKGAIVEWECGPPAVSAAPRGR